MLGTRLITQWQMQLYTFRGQVDFFKKIMEGGRNEWLVVEKSAGAAAAVLQTLILKKKCTHKCDTTIF